MIQQQTVLKVSDNSGAKTVRCIKVLGGFKKRYAKLGETIVVSVQALRNKSKTTSKIQKKEVYKALIISTKKKFKKKDGLTTFINNKDSNSVVLMNKKGSPIATRILSPIPISLKKKKLSKFLNISTGLI
jgi:large subunit ribosomal protein L14